MISFPLYLNRKRGERKSVYKLENKIIQGEVVRKFINKPREVGKFNIFKRDRQPAIRTILKVFEESFRKKNSNLNRFAENEVDNLFLIY